jgi:hypothetical protein
LRKRDGAFGGGDPGAKIWKGMEILFKKKQNERL